MTSTVSGAVAARFAAPELLNLGPPPTVASAPFETLRDAILDDMRARFEAIGRQFNTQNLLSDPNVKLGEAMAWRDQLRRQEIDNAVARTYLSCAEGAYLDARASDYGVLRRSIPYTGEEDASRAEPARPVNVPTSWTWDAASLSWKDDDDGLRLDARLSWEALSVAGPTGAYEFHARQAHNNVLVARAYGPETGYVEPGRVLLIVQSNLGDGVPTPAMLDAVADRLDAYEIVYASGNSLIRPVRNPQSVRPLGARVTVMACLPLAAAIEAVLILSPGPDNAALLTAALKRLTKYLDKCRSVGTTVARAGIVAALSLADSEGVPLIPNVQLNAPSEDVVPDYRQLVVVAPGAIRVSTVIA